MVVASDRGSSLGCGNQAARSGALEAGPDDPDPRVSDPECGSEVRAPDDATVDLPTRAAEQIQVSRCLLCGYAEKVRLLAVRFGRLANLGSADPHCGSAHLPAGVPRR
ncbi:unnamed protein product [Amoebophrya sp. A120]|nr:unnamed protein product [Amoebophrya sp. A120]|eukprot:GSA120T00006634001.1